MRQKRKITSRLYQDKQDLLKMLGLLMVARSHTSDWRYAHVGEFLFTFFMIDCHLDPRKFIRLWFDDAERLVGYAILGEDPSFDFQVHPDFTHKEIEIEALSWAESNLSELRLADPSHWSASLVSGSRQDDTRRIQFLESHGFQYRGRFAEANMIRLLSEPIPEIDPPTGYRVSSMAEVEAIPERAAVHREVWLPWTDGNVSDEDYVRMMHLPGYHADLDLVTITPAGVIAAFVHGWVDPINRIGDFGPVGARPAFRQQGLTRMAMIEGLRRMKAYGMERVCISTNIANTAALQLYQSLGFKIVNRYLDFIQES